MVNFGNLELVVNEMELGRNQAHTPGNSWLQQIMITNTMSIVEYGLLRIIKFFEDNLNINGEGPGCDKLLLRIQFLSLNM